MDLAESIRGINGQLADLLIILRISIVTIAIGPEPELGVGVETVSQDWHWVKGGHKVSDVPHLWLREGLRSTVGLSTLAVAHTFR